MQKFSGHLALSSTSKLNNKLTKKMVQNKMTRQFTHTQGHASNTLI